MGEEQPFRFLTHAEFAKLAVKEKAVYLVRASQELDERQRTLREQIARLVKTKS